MRSEIVSIALLLVTSSSCLSADSLVHEKEVAQSIGKVIMVHDTVWSYQDDSYRTGGFSISSTIDREYEKYVANKPVKYRVDFFWSIMMHVGLDASFFENFLILVNKDCGPEFIIRIDKFLNKSKELKINGPDQDRVKKVKSALLNMK